MIDFELIAESVSGLGRQTDAPTVHHWVLVRNGPETGLPPHVLGIFRRTDRHEVEQVGILQVIDPAIDPKRLGDEACRMFDGELKGRVS